MINFLSQKMGLSKRAVRTVLFILSITAVIILIFLKQYIDQRRESAMVTPPEIVSFDPIVPFPDPAPGKVEIGGTRIGISLFMGTEVDLSTFEVETDPQIQLTPKVLPDNPERVVLTPQTEWEAGQKYTITIKKGLLSEVTGREMKDDLILEYEIIDAELVPPSDEISPLL